MKVFLLIFISIILVTSVSLAINHPSFGYGGGGGGGGGGSGSTGDSRVCGDKLCTEIPGGREAWESRTNTKEVESELSNTEQVSSLSNSPRKQMQNGIAAKDVVCKSGLELMIRTSGDAVCVKPSTAEKLTERGWGVIPEKSSIDSFEKCAAAGNPVMESYPRQCRTSDGKHFVEIISPQKQCENEGGLWGIWGNAVPSSESCNASTSDEGMECTDSSQCQSFCQAKEGSEINSESTGMCYGYELAICMQVVQTGIVQPEWCQITLQYSRICLPLSFYYHHSKS